MSAECSQRLFIVGRKAAILILGNSFVTYPGNPAYDLMKNRWLDSGLSIQAMACDRVISHGWIDMFLARMAVDRLAKQ